MRWVMILILRFLKTWYFKYQNELNFSRVKARLARVFLDTIIIPLNKQIKEKYASKPSLTTPKAHIYTYQLLFQKT